MTRELEMTEVLGHIMSHKPQALPAFHPRLRESLTLLVMFVMQGIGFCLHAVVQLHEQGLQACVHPLDQFMINHQGPQQDTQHCGLGGPLRAQNANFPRAFI